MHIADIIVVLIGIGMLGVLLTCFVAAFGVWRGLGADYLRLLARARAHPRFGMSAMFTIVTIAAVASGLFRWAITDSDHPVLTAIVAFAVVVFAIGIVCGVQFVLAEFRENWSRRRAPHLQREMVWQEPVCSEKNQAEIHPGAEHAS